MTDNTKEENETADFGSLAKEKTREDLPTDYAEHTDLKRDWQRLERLSFLLFWIPSDSVCSVCSVG